MNVLTIRDLANAAAQDAFHRLVAYSLTHDGEWDRHLTAEWLRAEDLVDAIDELPTARRLPTDPGNFYAGMPA